jgi:hypothetical protein
MHAALPCRLTRWSSVRPHCASASDNTCRGGGGQRRPASCTQAQAGLPQTTGQLMLAGAHAGPGCPKPAQVGRCSGAPRAAPAMHSRALALPAFAALELVSGGLRGMLTNETMGEPGRTGRSRSILPVHSGGQGCRQRGMRQQWLKTRCPTTAVALPPSASLARLLGRGRR